jgi:inosine-uridine nucleoside N-ribohydrolase
MKVILDVDPGIDDAIALLIALNSATNIAGITTVHGNVEVEKTTWNVVRILQALDKQITVARGASKPLVKRPVHSKHIHGNDGLGNCKLPVEKARTSVLNVKEFWQNILPVSRKREITIVATGPLTNIAALLEKYQSYSNKIEKIILMGGVYGLVKSVRGNVTPLAEFNIYCDPEAADIVFNSGVSVDAVGLDVAGHPDCVINENTLNAIRNLKGRSAEIAFNLLSYPVSRYKFFSIYDAFAIARLLRPAMFSTVSCKVTVDKFGKHRGRCAVAMNEGNVNVCSSVNSKEFAKFVIHGLSKS